MPAKQNPKKPKLPQRKSRALLPLVLSFVFVSLAGYIGCNSYLDWRDKQAIEQIDQAITKLHNKLVLEDSSVEWKLDRHCVQPEEKYRELQLYCVAGTTASVPVKSAQEVKRAIDKYRYVIGSNRNGIVTKPASPEYPDLERPLKELAALKDYESGKASYQTFDLKGLSYNICEVTYIIHALDKGNEPVLKISASCSVDTRQAYFPITERP